MKIVAFVPIKFHSERLKNKNFLNIKNKPLCWHIFNVLLEIDIIDDIYVYCSNKDIVNYIPENITYLERSSDLDSNNTLGMEIYKDFCSKIEADIYVLAHATSPFIKSESIINGLNNIINYKYDSSLSVKEIKNFIWFENKPLNYELDNIPRTQTIEPIYQETSAFYIFRKELINKSRRIGFNPYFVITTGKESIDIDTYDDYQLAKSIN